MLIAQRSPRPRGRYTGVDADPEAIRRARKEAGLSQAQLGAPLLTKQAVQSIESGRVHPSHRSLSHIAERLGVSMEVLLREGATRADGRIRELQRLYEEHRYTDVLAQAEAILRTDVFDTRRRAGAHYYSGLAHYRLSVWPEAVEQLIQARECATAVPDPWLVAETFDVEAAARHELGDPSAAELAREALRRYRGLERRRADVEARMLENLGRILYRRGEYEAAERYYDEALDVMGAVRALDSVGRIYHGLAGARRRAGDLTGAADLMRTAIQLYKVEHELPDGGEVSPHWTGSRRPASGSCVPTSCTPSRSSVRSRTTSSGHSAAHRSRPSSPGSSTCRFRSRRRCSSSATSRTRQATLGAPMLTIERRSRSFAPPTCQSGPSSSSWYTRRCDDFVAPGNPSQPDARDDASRTRSCADWLPAS
ncbi:MAG: tetratricopeptide repeat protein [Chloroflexi bacterium]|nr:MAG: tetratricopeptide repeat protein [Chloroflexota bacterium]